MDVELPKRNTDCVYFLASPFTCKKGTECEYRHSEMARLNPRDCWFWLCGSCLNPTCVFRHPPMDTHSETPAQVEVLPNEAPLPPSKNNTPCYFYFNGYCSKGDRCSFLHGSGDISAGKLKVDSASTDTPPLDTKVRFKLSKPKIAVEESEVKVPSSASVFKIKAEQLDSKVPSALLDTKIRARNMDSKECPLTEPVPDPPGKGHDLLEVPLKVDDKLSLHQKKRIPSSDSCNTMERKILRHSLSSEFEEAAISKSASLNPPENMVKSDPSIYSDQSSEDQVEKDVVRDEWWESSPGFDVLVEGRSEGMVYGDEQECMHGYNDVYDGNDKDHENEFLDHCYEDQNNSNDRFLHDNRMREPSYYSDEDERYDLNHYSHGIRGKNHIMSRKRKFVTIGLPIGGHYSGDLREHLSERRFHAKRGAFRHCSFPFHTEERGGEPQRSSIQRLHGRLASKLERNGVSLKVERSGFVFPDRRGHATNKQLTTRHHQHERKRLQFPPRVQKRPFSRQKRESDNNNVSFAGPKTLAQIKEEKDRARDNVSLTREARHSFHNSSVDFDGPKPLTEILQVKKRGSSNA